MTFQAGEAWITDDFDAETTQRKQTTRMALLASAVNEIEDAQAMMNYARYHWPRKDRDIVERALTLRTLIATARPESGSITLQTNNRTVEFDVENGQTHSFTLLPEEFASLKVSKVKGDVDIITSYDIPQFTGGEQQEGLSITKAFSVDGEAQTSFNEGDIVRIDLTPTIASSLVDGRYEIVDYLPSGLRPLTRSYQPGLRSYDQCVWYPARIDDHRIYFHVWHDFARYRCASIGYFARVVTPGTYRVHGAHIRSTKDVSIETQGESSAITISQ